MYDQSRREFLARGGAVTLAVGSGLGTGAVAGSQAEDGPPTDDRGLPQEWDPGFLREQRLSAQSKDGIPSIDDPTYAEADGSETPDDGDIVFGVAIDGEARAYPQNVLVWHEIVNTEVGSESVAVTYCPLTGTAQGFYRDGVEFGVSGNLINNNLVMYDRETDAQWPQILAMGISSPHEDDFLEEFRVVWTSWRRWKSVHPDTQVLTEDTGHVRDYNDDPYGAYNPATGYYTNEDPFVDPLETDDRLANKEVVIGSRTSDGALAVQKATLRDRGAIEGTVGDVSYVTVYDPVLDTGHVYRNPDGATVEYDGGTVTVDGSEYDAHALPLEEQVAFDAMWMAWVGYYPSTTLQGDVVGDGFTLDQQPTVLPVEGDIDAGNRAADGFGPGFGVGGAIAGLGGAGYLLARRFRDEEA